MGLKEREGGDGDSDRLYAGSGYGEITSKPPGGVRYVVAFFGVTRPGSSGGSSNGSSLDTFHRNRRSAIFFA